MLTRTAMTGLLLLTLSATTGMVSADRQDWQQAIQLDVQLGDETGARVFKPDLLELEVNRNYRLVLTNPSPERHYFQSNEFSQTVTTRKVKVRDADGIKVAEVKGKIRNIEVYPGGTAEWWFTTMEAGTFSDLKCGAPGHTEAGMIGKIIVD